MKIRAADLRCVPGNFGALREIADAQANARENIVERQAAGGDHF